MKVLLNTVALEAQTHVVVATRIKASLSEALDSIKRLEEEAFTLKGELLETFDLYFEPEKEQVTFLYSGLNLSKMDLFTGAIKIRIKLKNLHPFYKYCV